MLTLSSKNLGSNFLDETAQYMIDTYGYRPELFTAEQIEVTLTGTSSEIDDYNLAAEGNMLPCADENGVFITDAATLVLVKDLLSIL